MERAGEHDVGVGLRLDPLTQSWNQRKTFVSHRELRTVADECIRMLRGFRVTVDSDEYEAGACLKCKVESFRGNCIEVNLPVVRPDKFTYPADPAGGIIYEKHLRFTVDIRLAKSEEETEGSSTPCAISFNQERGSATVFNIVTERFHSEWL